MIIRWLLIASFLLLIACYAHQHTAAHPIRFPEFREGRTVVKSAQNKIQPTLALENGMLKIQTPAGAAISGIKLRLSFRDGSSLTGSLQPAGQEMAEDKAGSYERFWYRLSANSPRRADANTPDVKLEVRHYKKSGVVVALMDYTGPALAPADGIQIIMRLESFARGLALKRLKLYWTGPIFTSDYRLLPAANQLLLWRQMRGDDYHLLVPLAGDGMIGELGVEEIDFRYEFRVSLSSHDPNLSPRHIPLFAYAAGDDPYRLPNDTYHAAFVASNLYGRLRWEKSYPEIFRWLGWCSWNTYYHEVTEEKVLNSVRSLQNQQIPVGFILVDDG